MTGEPRPAASADDLPPADAPLAGVRIVAVEQYGAGPFGTMYLADLGAEVIKVEDPGTGGDISRYIPPGRSGSDSLFFEAFNRTKRSVALDLKSPGGSEVLARLLATCPDTTLRDPDEAVTLAKAACDSTTPTRAEFVDTLAIAYAAQGNFDDAVKAIRSVTNTAGIRPQLLKELREHLALFERREAVVLPETAVPRTDE